MNNDSDRDAAKILYKLMRLGKWEHAHTSIDNLIKGFPKHKRGEVRKLIPKLIQQGFLHVKPTAYGREVSLNIQRKREIEELVLGISNKLNINQPSAFEKARNHPLSTPQISHKGAVKVEEPITERWDSRCKWDHSWPAEAAFRASVGSSEVSTPGAAPDGDLSAAGTRKLGGLHSWRDDSAT